VRSPKRKVRLQPETFTPGPWALMRPNCMVLSCAARAVCVDERGRLVCGFCFICEQDFRPIATPAQSEYR
jgi:hypothetical protein